MAREETKVQKIARLTCHRYPFFGQFTKKGGVDVEDLVRFILAKSSKLESAQRHKIGDDARDYINTSDFIRSLSNKALGEIAHLGRGDIHRHLREKTYPFARLNKKARETLLHLPNSWIHGAADWLLRTRQIESNGPQVRILAD